MKPKPKLNRDEKTGVWTAIYKSEFGQIFQVKGHSPGEATKTWYQRFGKKFGLKSRG